MKSVLRTIVQGSRLFQHLKLGEPSFIHLAASQAYLPRVLHFLNDQRVTEDAYDEDDDEDWDFGGGGLLMGDDVTESGQGFFPFDTDGLVGDTVEELMQNFESCGVDAENLSIKFMSGVLSAEFDDPDTIWPIVLSLKDDDEEVCSDEELLSMKSASSDFLECAGINNKLDMEYSYGTLEEACEEFYNIYVSGTILEFDDDYKLDEVGVFVTSGRRCLRSILGNNPIGDIIRYSYNNMDTVLSCLSEYGEKLPKCVLTTSRQEEMVESKKMTLPLSLEKKMACSIGSSHSLVIANLCSSLYEGLDACLPEVDADYDKDEVDSSCNENGVLIGKQDAFLGMDMSVLTGNNIPDFCSKLFEDENKDTSQLRFRLEYYNQSREYGWTIEENTSADEANDFEHEPNNSVKETTSNEAVNGTEEQGLDYTSSPAVAANAPAQYEGIDLSENQVVKANKVEEQEVEYESPLQDINLGESPDWDDGETAQFSPTTPVHILALGISAIAFISALVFFARSLSISQSSQSSQSLQRREYSNLAKRGGSLEMA